MKVLLCITVLVAFQMAMGSVIPVPKVHPVHPMAYAVRPPPQKFPNPHVPAGRAVEGCGVANTRKGGRVVGGTEATPHEFPWVVGLFMNSGSFCTGSLISDQWVVTAAHCVDGASYIDVVLGAHEIRNSAEQGQITLRSTNFTYHPTWRPAVLTGDIAVIQLPRAVQFTDNIRPICLQPSSLDSNFVDQTVHIAGWGKTSDASNQISPTLQKTTSKVITNAVCQNTYGAIITANIMCTSQTTNGVFQGTCNGDSGSSLSWMNPADGLYYQVGVTSFVSSSGCQSGLPDGFTRYQSYNDWVLQMTSLTA